MSAVAKFVGKEEREAVESAIRLLKEVIYSYFQEKSFSSSDFGRLSEYISGMRTSESSVVGISYTKYFMPHDIELKGVKGHSLWDLKDWLQNLLARLGDSHGLSKRLKASVLPTIEDAEQSVKLELRTSVDAAATEAQKLKAVSEQFQMLESSLREQLADLQIRIVEVREVEGAKNTDLKVALRSEKKEKGLMTQIALNLSKALDALAHLESLDQALGLTIQIHKALDATVEQLTLLNLAIQTVRQHKETAVREFQTAKASLDNVRNPEWLKVQVAIALGPQHQREREVATFVHERAKKACAPLLQAQVTTCHGVIDNALYELGKYEGLIQGQRFKTHREGYKNKRPAINALILKLQDEKKKLKADASNARQVLQDVRNFINAQKADPNLVQTDFYKSGKNFKACIDGALRFVDQALEGGVIGAFEPSAETGVLIDPALVQGIRTTPDLIRHLANETASALSGETGITTIIQQETDHAEACLERGLAAMAEMSAAVEDASAVRSEFIRSMPSFEQTRELPVILEELKGRIIQARQSGSRSQGLLRDSQLTGRVELEASSPVRRESIVVGAMADRARRRPPVDLTPLAEGE